MTIYNQHGYIDRQNYLQLLSEVHGIPMSAVQSLSDSLVRQKGSAADFTLLPIALMDYECAEMRHHFVETLTLDEVEE